MNAIIKRGAMFVAVLAGLGAVGSGCLTRPVASSEPLTSTTFTGTVSNTVIDKIDLLFDIDNSASMGDKQSYLTQAIPDLIGRLLNPNCDDAGGNPVLDANGNPVQSMNGACPAGDTLEFTPIKDMHIGIVTSSLGSRLSDQPAAKGNSMVTLCDPNATPVAPFTNISAHNDDQGHLVARSLTYTGTGTPTEMATEGTVGDAVVSSYSPPPVSGFLDWYPGGNNVPPQNPAPPAGLNAVTNQATLQTDFTQMVQGAGIYGCGIESQLESWYRFLVQPDPYSSLGLNSSGLAQWNGVDTTILQERADFLRPDSLVAVIVLTDENDSEIDVRSLGGNGYLFMGEGWDPIRGTSQCASNPGDPACVNCSNVQPGTCNPENYTAVNDWGFDPNLRHVHMKQKYGLDPQYPWQRYVVGLTQTNVPDRTGEYPSGASNYVGNPDCTNPLYAAQLPSGSALSGNSVNSNTLCNLPMGSRKSNLVFYAIIGGVPNQLLHFDPNSDANSRLQQSDWTKILGEGPAAVGLSDSPSYDYKGIDPHMIESYQDRTMLPEYSTADMTNPLTPAKSGTNSDPINGREWTTDTPFTTTPAAGMTQYAPHVLPVDRQYACIFKLQQSRDCSAAQVENGYQCDCPTTGTGLTADQVPPLCNPSNPTEQDYAKAYPTIRELQVARLMGNQGIVSSLCPIDVQDNAAMNDPLYGYRPAVTAIINRLKGALNNKCLPEKLAAGTDDAGNPGEVPCLILVQLPVPSTPDGSTCNNPNCDPSQGLSVPGSDVLSKFCAQQEAAWKSGGMSGADPNNQSVCSLTQLTQTSNMGDFMNNTCAGSQTPGWCYVEGAAAKGCAQAIVFTTMSPPPNSTTSLVCIEQTVNVVGDGG